MRLLHRFNDLLMALGSGGTILFVLVLALVVPYEVLGRYLLRRMTVWSGEVATFSLVWASLLGGAVGVRKGYAIAVTVLVERLPAPLAKACRVAALLCGLLFFGILFYYGLFQAAYNARQTSPALGMPMSIPYAALPAGFFLMFFFTLEELLLALGRGGREGR